MTTTKAKEQLIDGATAWHAAIVLTGRRITTADRALMRAVCRFLKAKSTPRKR